MKDVLVYADKSAVAAVASSRFLLRLMDLLAGQELVHVAVTGGGVGTLMLENLKTHPLTSHVDWSRVHIWWGDERFVAADDADRNALQARVAVINYLVSTCGLPEANVHEMPADTRDVAIVAAASEQEHLDALAPAAAAYQAELEKYFSPADAEDGFDLTLFGMGPDAHFASLFPGLEQISYNDPDQWVVGVTNSPKMPPLRLSLTVPFIKRSAAVWFFADGAAKADAAALALSKDDNVDAPSSFGEGREETIWMLDEAASAKLDLD